MNAADLSSRFDTDYWTNASAYSKYDGYDKALNELRGFNRGLVRRVVARAPGGRRHLDAGCGHGAVVFELLALGWDSHGLDASEWMIDVVRGHAPAVADRFAAGDLLNVPFEGTFALITCFQVLEHVEDPVRAISALGARLSQTGRLAITTPNLGARLPGWPDPLTSDPTHVSVHQRSWWEGAVRASGLRVVHAGTQSPIPLLWRLHPMLARWIPLGRRLGPDVLVIGERR